MPVLKLVLLTVMGLMLVACEHTAQGFGQDMEHAGQSIQRAVKS